MTGEEIKERINFNNSCIEAELDPAVFIFQKDVAKLLEENEKLREQCPHEFENGVCIYCGLKK